MTAHRRYQLKMKLGTWCTSEAGLAELRKPESWSCGRASCAIRDWSSFNYRALCFIWTAGSRFLSSRLSSWAVHQRRSWTY